MKDFVLKFTLASHTPIIHFENLSTLALRPTELKSKLDKFLISNNYVNSSKIQESTDGKKYLKYKIKIKNIKTENQQEIAKNDRNIPFYFGNMGNDYHTGDKKLVFIKSVDIEFFTFDKELLNVIKDKFEEFIAVTNFGTRQNKGYGSFYIKDKKFNENYIKGYKVTLKVGAYKQAMEYFETFYKFIRSGINLPQTDRRPKPFYTKPAIWKYFNDREIVWEKKAIKRRCLNDKLEYQQNIHNNADILSSSGEEKIVRDLLGLSTSQQWRSYNNITVSKDNQEIKRFKSPLMIKFIKNGSNYDVYFWNENRKEEKLEDFCGKTFRIQAGRCGFNLQVAEFNLDEFLTWMYNKRNSLLATLSQDRNEREYKIIDNILKNLQKVN